MKFGLLVSGNIGKIIFEFLISKYEIECVFTNKDSVGIINFASKNMIPCFIGNPRGGRAKSFIDNHKIDVLLSINYLFLIEKDLISWPQKQAINFHGSLLPKYRGRTPHVWAIINNEKFSGVTAHLIKEGCDTGGIVLQEKIEIKDIYTGADLLHIFERKYPIIVEKVIDLILADEVEVINQDESKASFFGKRTPEDGQIVWDWQKERIYNWVRAQAPPYPGAFSFIHKTKVSIFKVTFSDLGFSQDQPNGIIVEFEESLFVKTPNGMLKLDEYESELKLKHGMVFKYEERGKKQ